MQQRHGYSKAVLDSAPPGAPAEAEENIVAAAFARYIAGCESAEPGASPGGVAMLSRITGNLFAAAPGRSAGLYRLSETRSRACLLTATPMTDFRDAMISNATGFLPHSTASPAAFKVAAAARLGVLPEWQSACLSTPPTPKKLGWW